ncbi:MAG: PIN domain-containing protein [Gemmatimonadota bacterium]
MKLLLDTHFLLWAVTDHPRLAEFDWLEAHRPWGVSPVSFLEIHLLSEAGKLKVKGEAFVAAVGSDPRFVVDEAPLLPLILQAMSLDWTRDPFDRLLTAHSLARRTPLCTLDRRIRDDHPLIPRELRG